MLKTNFPDDIQITLGAMAPPLKQQVEAQGMSLANHELWEERHRAWNLLRIGGYLTDAETKRIGRRLVNGIGQDAHFEAAVHDLALELAGVAKGAGGAPAPGELVPTTDGEHDPAAGGELGPYLGEPGGEA
ncbi:MAG: hypothetical protein VKI63_05625 [Cyanobium sp.]|nr:hypothetical protein [Cyanobium sp.]